MSLEPFQAAVMELSCKNSERVEAANYLRKYIYIYISQKSLLKCSEFQPPEVFYQKKKFLKEPATLLKKGL